MISLSAYAVALDGNAPAPLDRGYQHLYDLEFDRAQQEFSVWQQQHPEDPMGPVSTAAGFLFAEFDRLGVLESQFYESDNAFDKRKKQTPDPTVRSRFDDTLLRSDRLARAKLQMNQND